METITNLQGLADALKLLSVQVETMQAQQEREQREATPTNKYMTFEQARQFLGVTRSALYTMCCRKRVPYYKPSGKALYFLQEDLEGWITSKRVKSAAEIESEASTLIIDK